MKPIILTIVSLGCFFASCSVARLQTSDSRDYYPPTIPEQIQMYPGDIEQKYEVLGSVAADAIGDTDVVSKHLKKKAAKMGADAIIKVELSKRNSAAISTGISDVAVKIKQAGNQ